MIAQLEETVRTIEEEKKLISSTGEVPDGYKHTDKEFKDLLGRLSKSQDLTDKDKFIYCTDVATDINNKLSILKLRLKNAEDTNSDVVEIPNTKPPEVLNKV